MVKIEGKEHYKNLKLCSKIFIVQFGSKSCLPCVAIKEKIEAFKKENNCVSFGYVSVEENQELSAKEGVFSVPTVLVFIMGKLFLRESGYFSLDEIFSKIRRYIDLMEE